MEGMGTNVDYGDQRNNSVPTLFSLISERPEFSVRSVSMILVIGVFVTSATFDFTLYRSGTVCMFTNGNGLIPPTPTLVSYPALPRPSRWEGLAKFEFWYRYTGLPVTPCSPCCMAAGLVLMAVLSRENNKYLHLNPAKRKGH